MVDERDLLQKGLRIFVPELIPQAVPPLAPFVGCTPDVGFEELRYSLDGILHLIDELRKAFLAFSFYEPAAKSVDGGCGNVGISC